MELFVAGFFEQPARQTATIAQAAIASTKMKWHPRLAAETGRLEWVFNYAAFFSVAAVFP
jgi:hypothetical protein